MPDSAHNLDREHLATTTFVELARQLVSDFDLIDTLTALAARSVELLSAAHAGILLVDEHGNLGVMAASSEETRLLELFQIQNDQGPSLDCFHTRTVVIHPDLTTSSPWPEFAVEAVDAGYRSVCAVPMQLADVPFGCLNLFSTEPGSLSARDVALAQALADVATITIAQDRTVREASIREEQLQHALNSRIVIEQAKGMIAERANVDMDEAFTRLRNHSRNHNLRMTELAQQLTVGVIDLGVVANPQPRNRQPRKPRQPA